MGSEGLATLFAAHLDGRLAAALTRVRDSGQLGAAIATALRETGVEARPDCPIERILSSALRRYELREWLR
jgi:phytoene dehydrogenase-like protein